MENVYKVTTLIRIDQNKTQEKIKKNKVFQNKKPTA